MTRFREITLPPRTDEDSIIRILEISRNLHAVTKVYEDAKPAVLRRAWDELRERERRVTEKEATINARMVTINQTNTRLDGFVAKMNSFKQSCKENEESVDRLNQEVEQYKASVVEKNLEVSSLQVSQQQAVSELETWATRIASLEKALQDVRADLEGAQSNSDQLRRDSEANTNELKRLEAEFQASEKSSEVKIRNLEILVRDRSDMVTELDKTLKEKMEELKKTQEGISIGDYRQNAGDDEEHQGPPAKKRKAIFDSYLECLVRANKWQQQVPSISDASHEDENGHYRPTKTGNTLQVLLPDSSGPTEAPPEIQKVMRSQERFCKKKSIKRLKRWEISDGGMNDCMESFCVLQKRSVWSDDERGVACARCEKKRIACTMRSEGGERILLPYRAETRGGASYDEEGFWSGA
ncbi:hypothetical protein SLS56_000680 [Neofusicoccum ribis]|uniref:Zn(2)-C6 fungal-type domain-containing protein n=1 Tax=Neofusicoccum ribis TaxID=45134 RepID=A0ABR3TDI7_9PEZI